MPFRLKTFLIHLGVSVLVGCLSLYWVFVIWHPDPLQKLVGVTSIFLMLLAIDVVVGPLLSLLVASSPKKKTLKFDLTIVCILQITAYLYGMHSIAMSRPVYLAFDKVRVEVVQADTVQRENGENLLAEYRHNPLLMPKWVAVRPYRDEAEQSQRTFMELQTGISPAMRADLYQPFDEAWPQISIVKSDLEALKQFNPVSTVNALKLQYPEADGYLPVKGSMADAVLLLDSKTHRILAIVDLKPW